MIDQDRRAGAPPHGAILAVVVAIVVAVPFIVGDGGEAVTEAISELLSPVGLLLLPIALLLAIQLLSASDRRGGGAILSGIFSGGDPDSIHRAGGSPAGVALVLLLVVFLLYNRVSLFGGGDDDSGD